MNSSSTEVSADAISRVAAALCRICGLPVTETFVNLGMSPLANSFIADDRVAAMEPFYPLHVHVCSGCMLVQLEEWESDKAIFSEYLYFSSYSESWMEHARVYAEAMRSRFKLDERSLVVEVASNDGYLLQWFVRQGIPVLGIEPAANVAKVATERGVPSRVMFFDEATARGLVDEGFSADLVAANNVLAHVPRLHSFVAGFKSILKPDGVITFEFPHLLELMQHTQFDTIYHEHFSYLSLLVVERLLAEHGLNVFDVEQLTTHGGSLRVYAHHAGCTAHQASPGLQTVRQLERLAGLHEISAYRDFAPKVIDVKCRLLEFLIGARREGRHVAGYGAPAKGNTLLNYCGVGPELLAYTVDRSPHKQGTLLPGTRIPVYGPERIAQTRPDYLLILPWNLRDEIIGQMSHVREWGGQFVVPIPSAQVIP